MRLGATIPELGETFDWDVSEILERVSGDMSYINDFVRCIKCNTESDLWTLRRLNPALPYEGSPGPCLTGEKHYWQPLPLDERWELLLDQKRLDSQYEPLLKSIPISGIRTALNAYLGEDDEGNPQVQLCDGHHRFAAAVALQLATVPVVFNRSARYDSHSDFSDPESWLEPR